MHISKSTGNIIVKAEGEVAVGEFVYDSRSKRVGVVFDFFGPVEQPFIAVKPNAQEPVSFIGSELFVVEQQRHRGKRR